MRGSRTRAPRRYREAAAQQCVQLGLAKAFQCKFQSAMEALALEVYGEKSWASARTRISMHNLADVRAS